MDAVAERHVRAGVLAADVECLAAGKLGVVAVGRTGDHQDFGAGRQFDAADRLRVPRLAPPADDGRREAQDLLDRVRDLRRIGADCVPSVAIVHERDDRVAHERGRRLVPGEQHGIHEAGDFLVGDLLAGGLRAHEIARQIVTRKFALVADQLLAIVPVGDHVVRMRDLFRIGQVAPGQRQPAVSEGLDHRHVFVGNADQREQHVGGNGICDFLPEIDLLAALVHVLDRIEMALHDRLDLRLDRLEAARTETLLRNLADARVLWRHARGEAGIGGEAAIGHDPAALLAHRPHRFLRVFRREGLPVVEYLLHVGVARDDPVAGFLMEEDRLLLPEQRPVRLRRIHLEGIEGARFPNRIHDVHRKNPPEAAHSGSFSPGFRSAALGRPRFRASLLLAPRSRSCLSVTIEQRSERRGQLAAKEVSPSEIASQCAGQGVPLPSTCAASFAAAAFTSSRNSRTILACDITRRIQVTFTQPTTRLLSIMGTASESRPSS